MAALRFCAGFCLILWATPILAPAADVAKPRTDAHGDALPPGALARFGTARFRLPPLFYSLALSADGKLLAAGNGDGVVILIDAVTGLEVRRIKVGSPGPVSMDHATYLDERQTRYVLPGSHGDLFFSPDNSRLVTVSAKGPEIHDIQTGKRLAAFDAVPPQGLPFADMSADGKWLVVAGIATVGEKVPTRVWNLESKKEVAALDVLHDRSVRVRLSAGGKVLANWRHEPGGSQDFSSILQLWDTATGKELRRIQVGGSLLGGNVAFSPSGKQLAILEHTLGFASTLGPPMLGIWDVASGTQQRRLAVRRGSGTVLRFSPDGKVLVFGAADGVIQTWDVAGGKQRDYRSGPECGLAGVQFFGGKMLAAGRKNQAVYVWDPSTGQGRSARDQPTSRITSLAFSRDGKVLMSAGDSVRWWDVAAGKTIRQFSPRDDGAASLGPITFMLGPENKYLCMGRENDSGLRIFDLAKGKELCDLTAGHGTIVSAFAGDGKTFAAGEYRGAVRVWDLSSGEQTHRLLPRADRTEQLALSANGKMAALGVNIHDRNDNSREVGQVQLWDLTTGKETVKIPVAGWTTGLGFSPDAKVLATACGQKGLYLWDTTNGMRLRALEKAGTPSWQQVQFSPDGRLLAAVVEAAGGEGNGTVVVWEVTSGKVRAEFNGHRGAISALAFAPDGRTLATGGDDTTVLLWDLAGRLAETTRPDGK